MHQPADWHILRITHLNELIFYNIFKSLIKCRPHGFIQASGLFLGCTAFNMLELASAFNMLGLAPTTQRTAKVQMTPLHCMLRCHSLSFI